jgi:uncharacterized RDD family membrane protein YckC
MQTLLDTVRFNETPEGVDLGLRVAGPAPRALALALDWLIRFALYLVLAPLAAFSGLGAGLILLGAFLIEWLYPVIFEVLKGATPGKRAMGLAVVHDDGTPVGLPASMIRNLLRVVDFLPILYGVGLISTLVDPDFRRLGDLAAGTLVIHAEGRDAKLPIPLANPRPPPPGLTLAAQQAILAFAERSERLSLGRREELAETLVARLGGPEPVHGRAAVERVQGYASWLARGR